MPNWTEGLKRYPLSWPRGVRRTSATERRQQYMWERQDFNKVLNGMRRELSLLGVPGYILSTNQPIRNDGMPYAQERIISDPGAACWFELNGKKLCLPCDKWGTIKQNVRAIAMHIESIRGQERWGVGTTEQAFAGYAALPANSGDGIPWRTVLQYGNGPVLRKTIEFNFRALAQDAHPDKPGGSEAAMQQLNRAREEALREVPA